MPIDDSKKRDVIQNITTLLRQTKLAGNVDMQRMGMAFSMVLDNVDAGQPIDLQSLYEWLTQEAKVDERAVIEVCVVLKAREQRLGVEFVLPHKVNLSPEVVDSILEKFHAGAGKGQTYDRKEPPPAPGKGPAPAAGFTPAQKKKGSNPLSADRRMLLVLVAVLVVGAAFYSYYLGTKTPPLEQIQALDSAGLTCTKLETNGTVAICEIAPELWATEGEALRVRAEITKNELKRDRGIATLYVMTANDKKVRFRL